MPDVPGFTYNMARDESDQWRSVPCPTCGADIAEACFETDRVLGRVPPEHNQEHEARILMVVRQHHAR